jgi:hypothetical protein
MKLTIIPNDGVVGVDGVFRTVSMAGIDPTIHAVQFDDSKGGGEVESILLGVTPQKITDRSAFQPFVDRWTAAAPPVPVPPTQAQLDDRQARAQLTRLDAQSIRHLRVLAGGANVGASAALVGIENAAISQRAKLIGAE